MTQRYRGVITGLITLAVLLDAAPRRPAADEAMALLTRVAAHYQHMNDYDVEVTVRNNSVPLAEFMRVYHFAASGAAMAHLTVVRGSGRLPDQIISDGAVVWSVRRSDHEYREERFQAAGQPFGSTDAAKQLAIIQMRYKGRFATIAGRPMRAPKFEGYRELDVAGKKVKCAVIRIGSPKGEPASSTWTDVLWIDPERALVMHSEGAFPPGSGSAGMETLPRFDDVQYAWHRVEPPLDPALFRFTPPSDFKKVDHLKSQ